MATTQQRKPTTGGNKNAVVLKPLNLNRTGGPRIRRTTTQVLSAKVQAQKNLAEKAQQRADALAARQLRAQQRAQRALDEAQRIEQEAATKAQEAKDREQREREQQAAIQAGEAPRTTSTVPVVPKTPQIERMLKDITKDFKTFYAHMREKYGVEFEGTDPELVKRGYISVKMRGFLAPQIAPVEVTSSDTGVAREAVRFMQFYKTVGLTPAWLNKEVKIKDDPNTYVLTGLRGKAHAIVLRRKDDQTQAFTMPATDFKKVLQS
jgi:hypothetical protein